MLGRYSVSLHRERWVNILSQLAINAEPEFCVTCNIVVPWLNDLRKSSSLAISKLIRVGSQVVETFTCHVEGRGSIPYIGAICEIHF